MIMRTAFVGRTPSSAPDPLVRLFQHTKTQGRRGRRPQSLLLAAGGTAPLLAFIYTRVIARFIRTAHAFVASDRWVGTNGLGAIRLIRGGDDFSGRTSFLYPALQCCLDAVLAIGARTWNR